MAIRESVADAAQLPEKITLRGLIEWYKEQIRVQPHDLTTEESAYIDTNWGHAVKALAEAHALPAGSLSYFLGELAVREHAMPEVAAEEVVGGEE